MTAGASAVAYVGAVYGQACDGMGVISQAAQLPGIQIDDAVYISLDMQVAIGYDG